jgi:hypothetical protein
VLAHFVGRLEYRFPRHIGLFGEAGYDLVNPVPFGQLFPEFKTRERLLEGTRGELDKIAGSKRRASAKTLGARVGRVYFELHGLETAERFLD